MCVVQFWHRRVSDAFAAVAQHCSSLLLLRCGRARAVVGRKRRSEPRLSFTRGFYGRIRSILQAVRSHPVHGASSTGGNLSVCLCRPAHFCMYCSFNSGASVSAECLGLGLVFGHGQVHNERLTRGLISNYLQSDWMLVNDTRSPEEVGGWVKLFARVCWCLPLA